MYYLLNNRFWTKILTDNNDLQHFKVNTEGKNIEKTRSFSLMHRPMQKITRCSQREHAHIRRPYPTLQSSCGSNSRSPRSWRPTARSWGSVPAGQLFRLGAN